MHRLRRGVQGPGPPPQGSPQQPNFNQPLSGCRSYRPINKLWPLVQSDKHLHEGEGRQSLSTCRYVILTGGQIRLSLLNHAVQIGGQRSERRGADPERLRGRSSKRLQ